MVKNGLAMVSIGLLMLIVMGVDHKTMMINNLGIFLTSMLITGIGIALAVVGNKRDKAGKSEGK
jgi:hypothetical protein